MHTRKSETQVDSLIVARESTWSVSSKYISDESVDCATGHICAAGFLRVWFG